MLADDKTCYGLAVTSPASMPSSHETIGLYVRTIERFLHERRPEDALVDQMIWLTPD